MVPVHSAASPALFATAVAPVEPRPPASPRPFSEGAAPTRLPAPGKTYRWLLGLFVVSLVLINPWVRGDGVGYYAFARAVFIQRNLDFTADYNAANASFRDARLDENGNAKPVFHTATNHLENHFSVGPAILWAPFLIIAHIGVLVARALGSSVAADGFSAQARRPLPSFVLAMRNHCAAIQTAVAPNTQNACVGTRIAPNASGASPENGGIA